MTGDVQVPDGGGVEAMRAEVRAATEDYRRIFPEPYSLAPNLNLAVRAVAALDAALASQPAPTVTEEAVEAGVGVADAMNADAWIVVPDRNTGEPSQQQVPLSHLVEGILTAALPHLTRAQSGDGVAEKAWDEGHRRGYSDGYDDNGNGYEHDPDVDYTPAGNPYRIARTTTEEGE